MILGQSLLFECVLVNNEVIFCQILNFSHIFDRNTEFFDRNYSVAAHYVVPLNTSCQKNRVSFFASRITD